MRARFVGKAIQIVGFIGMVVGMSATLICVIGVWDSVYPSQYSMDHSSVLAGLILLILGIAGSVVSGLLLYSFGLLLIMAEDRADLLRSNQTTLKRIENKLTLMQRQSRNPDEDLFKRRQISAEFDTTTEETDPLWEEPEADPEPQ